MEKKTTQQIKRALREVWLRSTYRTDAVREGRERVEVGTYKNGNRKFRTFFKCALCSALVDKKNFNIDHKQMLDQTNWDTHITSLFCEPSDLQLLCLSCHKHKTSTERKV